MKSLRESGSLTAGYEQGLWTLGRIRAFIPQRFGVHYSEVADWKLLRELKWSPQKPEKRAREADRQTIYEWKARRWPELVAEAEKEQRVIVFQKAPPGQACLEPPRKSYDSIFPPFVRGPAPSGEAPPLELHRQPITRK